MGGFFSEVKMAKVIDLTGQKFGRLTVLKRTENSKAGKARWLCLCDCGNHKIITGNSLESGNTISCGCYRREIVKNLNCRHFDSKSRLYNAWQNMYSRCNNENNTKFKYYGGRGITVCNDWKDYMVFREWALKHGYSDDLTLDRIDVNGNYCPENCRWVTWTQQQRNRRSNHIVAGKTLMEWAEITGLKYQTLVSRANRGCSIGEILSISKLDNRKRH